MVNAAFTVAFFRRAFNRILSIWDKALLTFSYIAKDALVSPTLTFYKKKVPVNRPFHKVQSTFVESQSFPGAAIFEISMALQFLSRD